MITETVTPAGLRERAKIMRDILDESCARHLELAADEIERLRSFEFAQTPAVRPMEWDESEGQLTGQRVWSSGDPWVFWIVKNPGEQYIWCENFNIEGWCPASPVRGSFDTLQDAKGAAQADYTNRILAALADTSTDRGGK